MLRKHKDGPWREAYRPESFEEFSPTTNSEALKRHFDSKDRSQTYMFHGETGTGKTTMAYIMGKLINCESPSSNGPCNECDNCRMAGQLIEDCNMGSSTGIDETRALIERIQTKPLINAKRVIILDEAHALTKQAQKAWLKVLEDPRPWLYVFFCTTDAEKFLPDLRNRCHMVEFRRLSEEQSIMLMTELATLEKVDLTKEQAKELYEIVGGRPRELVNAVQVFSTGGEVEQDLEEKIKAEVKDLVTTMLAGVKDPEVWQKMWTSFISLYEENDSNAEGLRRMVLWWLWHFAQNPTRTAHKLTRIMEVLSIFSNPVADEDAKYQFAVMMFKAWKQ